MSFIGQLHEEHKRVTLDLLDRKIVYLLSKNGRYARQSIAKSLKTSKEVVHYKMKRLEKHGFLHGVLTLFDHRKLNQCIHEVSVSLHPTHDHTSLLSYLQSKDTVNHIAVCSAPHDVQFQVTTRNADYFVYFLDTVLAANHAMIQDYTVSKILENHFTGLDFVLLPDDERPRIVEHKGSSFSKEFSNGTNDHSFRFDEKDKDILRCLALNGRIPVIQLSQQMQLAPTSVQKRIRTLIEYGFIKNFVVYCSVSFLGYQWYVMRLRTKGLNDHTFLTFLKQQQNITWMTKRIGRWNYHLSIFAKNNTELNSVIQEIRHQFMDAIIDYDSMIVFKQMKYTPVVL